jgi:hypothetical protein
VRETGLRADALAVSSAPLRGIEDAFPMRRESWLDDDAKSADRTPEQPGEALIKSAGCRHRRMAMIERQGFAKLPSSNSTCSALT